MNISTMPAKALYIMDVVVHKDTIAKSSTFLKIFTNSQKYHSFLYPWYITI